jgi:hypothetical protein
MHLAEEIEQITATPRFLVTLVQDATPSCHQAI